MINLSATTDKLQVVTGSAGDVDTHVSYADVTRATGAISGVDRQHANPTTATTTDILAAPASGDTRNAKMITVRNTHASNSNSILVQFNQNSTIFELFKYVLAAGEQMTYTEGFGWDVYAADGSHKAQSGRVLFYVLDADDTGGTNVATAQPWFPTAGGVTVEAATTYMFEGQLFLSRAAGTTSHTTGILFGGTATLTNIDYLGRAKTGDTNALAAENAFRAISAASLVLKAASTSATEQAMFEVNGIVRINAAGTFIPQFIYSTAPGGTPTVKRGSFFRMWPVGSNTIKTQGTWA